MNGKNMTGKTKFLIFGLPLLVALSSFMSHLWSCTFYALEKAVAAKVLSLVLSKILAGISSMHFLL